MQAGLRRNDGKGGFRPAPGGYGHPRRLVPVTEAIKPDSAPSAPLKAQYRAVASLPSARGKPGSFFRFFTFKA